MQAKGAGGEASGIDAGDWQSVRACPLFEHLGPEMTRRLIGHRRPIGYEPRQMIFAQGDRADAFFVVLDGWVKLYRLTPSGEEAVVSVFTRSESFAEPVMFLGGVYPASAEAASRVRLLKIDAAGFLQAIGEEPGLAAAMLASVVHHTEQLASEIASLKLLSAPRRVAEFLIRQAEPEERDVRIVLPHEKALLAGRLGMTPESLSRALALMRKLGVEVEREHIHISDVGRLREFAAETRTRARS